MPSVVQKYRCCRHPRRSGRCPGRPGQTADEPRSQGIARDEDNWNRCGRGLRRQCRRYTHRQDNIGFEAEQFFNEFRKALAPALGPSLHKSNVLAIDVTMLAHPLAECIQEVLVGGPGLGAEERDAGGCDQTVRRLLRPRRERLRSLQTSSTIVFLTV